MTWYIKEESVDTKLLKASMLRLFFHVSSSSEGRTYSMHVPPFLSMLTCLASGYGPAHNAISSEVGGLNPIHFPLVNPHNKPGAIILYHDRLFRVYSVQLFFSHPFGGLSSLFSLNNFPGYFWNVTSYLDKINDKNKTFSVILTPHLHHGRYHLHYRTYISLLLDAPCWKYNHHYHTYISLLLDAPT